MFPPNRAIAALAVLASSVAGATAEPATIETNVNLRSGPGGAFDVVAVMPAGSKLGMHKCGDEWCPVTFGHVTGYASRALLKRGDAPQLVTAPEPRVTQTNDPLIWDWLNPENRDRAWRDIQWHNRWR
jgi:uncharacterized protein YraI